MLNNAGGVKMLSETFIYFAALNQQVRFVALSEGHKVVSLSLDAAASRRRTREQDSLIITCFVWIPSALKVAFKW